MVTMRAMTCFHWLWGGNISAFNTPSELSEEQFLTLPSYSLKEERFVFLSHCTAVLFG